MIWLKYCWKCCKTPFNNCKLQDLQKLITKLQGDISEAERKKKDSAKETFDQTQKDKDKHEKLRKELEAQRLRYVFHLL